MMRFRKQHERERERSENGSFVPVLNEPCPDLSKPPVFMLNLNISCEASKQKMLDKMEKIEDPAITFNDAASLSIRFPDPGPLPKNELIQFDGLAFAYPGKTPLFQKATANLDIKGRIGILGANGVSWKDHEGSYERERERGDVKSYDLYDSYMTHI